MPKASKNNPPPATLGDQLKHAIAESGLTTYAVAKGAGVPQAVALRFISGQRDLRLATADKLATFFGMKLTPPSKPTPASKPTGGKRA